MIESLNFEIARLFWSIMLGLLWIVIEQAYEFVKPVPRELQVERKCGVQAKNKDDNYDQVKTSVPTAQSKSLPATSEQTNIPIGRILAEVDLDIKHLSREVLQLNTNKVPCNRNSNFKKADIKVPNTSNVLMEVMPLGKPLKDVKFPSNTCNLKDDCGTELFVGGKFNCLKELANGNNCLKFKQFPQVLEFHKICNLLTNISSQYEFNLSQMHKCGNYISMAPYNTVVLNRDLKNSLKERNLSADQFKSFLVAAYLIMSDLNEQRYQKLVSCVEHLICLGETNTAQFEQTSTGVVITELETEEVVKPRTEIDIEKIVEGTRLKKITKRRRKHKRQERPVFPSKQCLGRLAYYMSTRKKYSSSNLTMEIEKEMQPIKDQINELRNSLVDFNVVNCRYNTSGIKSSTICIEPTERNKKTCFIVASSQTDRENSSISDYFAEVKSLEKKLSPLAEMYVKLSQYK